MILFIKIYIIKNKYPLNGLYFIMSMYLYKLLNYENDKKHIGDKLTGSYTAADFA
jgi:hypothetical protein